MFAFPRGHFAYGCKHIRTLRAAKLNSCLRLNTEFLYFIFPVEKWKMRIKQWRIDRQMSSKLGSMGSENCFYRQFLAFDIENRKPCHPFMEMCNQLIILIRKSR